MNKALASSLVIFCGILRSTDMFFRNGMTAIFPVIVLAFWEHLVNLFVFVPVLIKNYRLFNQINRKDFILFMLVGAGASALGLICFTSSFKYINPAVAVIFQKTQPLIVILLSAFFLKERITKEFIFFSLIVLLCVIGITYDYNPDKGLGERPAIGAFFSILAAFFWGGGTVWGKELMKKYPASFLTAMRFFIGTIFTLIISLIYFKDLFIENLSLNQAWLSIIYMALISGTLAVSFFYIGLKNVNASLVGILELSFPVFSILISFLFLKKPLSLLRIGLSIILFYASYMAAKVSSTDTKKELS